MCASLIWIWASKLFDKDNWICKYIQVVRSLLSNCFVLSNLVAACLHFHLEWTKCANHNMWIELFAEYTFFEGEKEKWERSFSLEKSTFYHLELNQREKKMLQSHHWWWSISMQNTIRNCFEIWNEHWSRSHSLIQPPFLHFITHQYSLRYLITFATIILQINRVKYVTRI